MRSNVHQSKACNVLCECLEFGFLLAQWPLHTEDISHTYSDIVFACKTHARSMHVIEGIHGEAVKIFIQDFQMSKDDFLHVSNQTHLLFFIVP